MKFMEQGSSALGALFHKTGLVGGHQALEVLHVGGQLAAVVGVAHQHAVFGGLVF